VGDTDIDGRAAAAAGMPFLCYRRHHAQDDGNSRDDGNSQGDGNSRDDGPACLRDLRDLPDRLHRLNGG
jgi:hypothetical protein